jgi:ABC-2 type transport system permease protein
MIILEWKEFVRERGTWWIFAALVIASAIALGHGVSHYRKQAGAIASAHEQARVALEKARIKAEQLDADPAANVPYWLDPRDVGGFANYQLITFATKPPLPLAVLNIGQSDLYPSYVQLNTDAKDKALGTQEIYNPHHLLAGPFDFAFVVIFLAPLALVALGSTVASRDREQGTHALLAVATRVPWTVYARRLAMRALAIWLVLAGSVVIATLLGAVPGRPWLEVTIFVALVALYLAFWTGVIAAIGFSAESAAQSALRLFSVWIALLVVVPAVANFAVRRVEPVPPRAAFVQAMRDATDAISRERMSLLESYFVDHPEFAPADKDFNRLPFTITRIVTVQELERRVEQVEARYTTALDAQQRLLAHFELVSPGLWLQSALNRLSGTDLERQRDFLRQIGAYHAALREFFHPRILALSNQTEYRVCVDCPSATRTLDHFDFPQYRYTPFRTPMLAAPSAVEGLGALLAACLALLMWSRSRTRREF